MRRYVEGLEDGLWRWHFDAEFHAEVYEAAWACCGLYALMAPTAGPARWPIGVL